MPLFLSDSFVIRISRDGRPDKYVREGRGNRLATFQRMSSALDVVNQLRPLPAGEYAAVVPIEDVPEGER